MNHRQAAAIRAGIEIAHTVARQPLEGGIEYHPPRRHHRLTVAAYERTRARAVEVSVQRAVREFQSIYLQVLGVPLDDWQARVLVEGMTTCERPRVTL